MFKIKNNTTGIVRDKLFLEDIHIEHYEVAIEFGLIKFLEGYNEPILVLKEPLKVPKLNKFYASKIKSITDPYLLDLCKRLLYLNPNPDVLMQKKITEFILMRFSVMELVESEVKLEEELYKPALKFEEVFLVLSQALVSIKSFGTYEPLNETMVLFSRQSELGKKDKIRISKQCRGERVFELMENAIHTVAEVLMDDDNMVTVTTSRIKSTNLVRTSQNSASLNTIKKYMSSRTKAAIEDYNVLAPFKSIKTQENYEKFLALDKTLSLNEYVEILGVSKSTIVEFKKLQTIN